MTDFSFISLKTTFSLFCCYTTLFFAFLHWIKVFACLQLITLILAISPSLQHFCFFVAKLRSFQVYRTENVISLVCCWIKLFLVLLHWKEVFCLFLANHINFSFISLKTLFRSFAAECRYFLALLHKKQKVKISVISCRFAKNKKAKPLFFPLHKAQNSQLSQPTYFLHFVQFNFLRFLQFFHLKWIRQFDFLTS